MPIYEYQCDTCGSQRELLLKPGEAARPICATCRKRMRRVISQTAFVLKGSGWYVSDYPSEARKKGMEGEKAPAPAVETAAGKKDVGQTDKKTTAPPKSPAGKKGARKPG
jgi:putative FmdB family regulatory protein